MAKNRQKLFLKFAFERPTLLNSIKIAVVVGFILNFINQGDKLLLMDFANVNWFKFGLTFLVPFSVSSYSAGTAKLKFTVGDVATIDIDLKCKTCGKTQIHLKKGNTVPICEICQEKTQWQLF